MLSIKNMNDNFNNEVLEVGRLLFNNDDDLPLLEKAINLYIKELSYVIIDQEKSRIAGFILVGKKYTKIYHKFMTNVPNCYEISFLGIHPFYQGKGLGSQCLRTALLSIYRTCRTFNAWLIVDVINLNAIHLYKKLGFILWKFIDHPKYPSYIMGLSFRRYKTMIK